jgi:ATP-dependent RNA helicase DDX35
LLNKNIIIIIIIIIFIFIIIMYKVLLDVLPDPVPDYVQGVVDTCLKIHMTEPPGDVLAFLTGQEEVDRAVNLLQEHANQQRTDKRKS